MNTSGFGILVAPHGGSDRRLSANPDRRRRARPDGAPIILDISTSAIAEGKIQVAKNRGESLPPGCTIDSEGRPNQDPDVFYGPPVGALLPIGGHKGYGLSIFCEIFAGALSGGQTTNPANATARPAREQHAVARVRCGSVLRRASLPRRDRAHGRVGEGIAARCRGRQKSCCPAKSSAARARSASATACRSTR